MKQRCSYNDIHTPLWIALCKRLQPLWSTMSTSALLLTRVVAILSNLRESARSRARSPLLSSSFNLPGSWKQDITTSDTKHKTCLQPNGKKAPISERLIKPYLRVHLDEIEKDHIFSFNFDGFMERILCFRLDHLVQKLGTHGAEIFFPQIILIKDNQWKTNNCQC